MRREPIDYNNPLGISKREWTMVLGVNLAILVGAYLVAVIFTMAGSSAFLLNFNSEALDSIESTLRGCGIYPVLQILFSAVEALDNANGTKGPHWSVADITSYAKSRGLTYANFNEYDFSYVLNLMFSDYYGTVSDSVDTYFKLAKAFLEDKDAPVGKAFLYYKAMKK